MKKQLFVLFIFSQLFIYCRKDEYCKKEILHLTDIILPKEIEVIVCEDNFENQLIFEYKLIDLRETNTFIKNNKLQKYSSKKNYDSIKEKDVINYVGEFFSPNKIYSKNSEIYYIHKDNYFLVLDKVNGKFMGLVEY